MKKLLLLLIIPALIAGNLTAQLSMEEYQILYLNFNDDADLGYNDEDIDVIDEDGIIGDEGKFNGGIYFDGDGDYLIMDIIEDFNHGMDFSLTWWMKSESTDDFWGILGFAPYSGDCNTDWLDEEPGVGGLFLSSYEGIANVEISWIGGLWPEEGNEPDPWNDGEWHHFALVYDVEAGSMSMYIDNVNYYIEEEPIAIAADLETVNDEEGISATLEDDNFRLGCIGRGWNVDEEADTKDIMWFEGYMDDVRLFDMPLTEEDVAEVYAYAPTGINEVQSSQLFSIYPNPASDLIKIRANSPDLEVYVYNIAGQVVLSSFNKTSLDISSLQKGMYFVDLTVNGDREVQKLIIK